MRRLIAYVLALLISSGCSRGYYRQSADVETQQIIRDRNVPIGDTELLRPAESRLHDPNSVEFPPKPPDDDQAAVYMLLANGMKGSSHWYKWGMSDEIEWNGWLSTLPHDDKGVVKIDQDKAVDLALKNSREYQSAVEQVYLTGLALTLNRFEFALRWFSDPSTNYTHAGSGGIPYETNTFTQYQNLGVAKDFAAGGQLVIDFLNTLMVQFTGYTPSFSSNISISFIQPLLRNAGRMIRMESLTQAERDTLYAARDFARYRKQFWADIHTNTYLNLLLQKQGIRNLEANFKSQELNLRFSQELFNGGKASVVQVDQSFVRFLTARQQIVDAQALYDSSLDSFKIQMGLPPSLTMDLDDSILNMFLLTSPDLDILQEQAEKFQQARFSELNEVPSLVSLKKSYEDLAVLLKRTTPFVDLIDKELTDWGLQLRASPKSEKEYQQKLLDTFAEFKALFPDIRKDLAKLDEDLKQETPALKEVARKEAWERSLILIRRLMASLDQLSNIQTRVRIYRIELPSFKETEANAVAFAKANRLDFMNLKGRVTDNWRKVQVAANALKGEVNIVSNVNLATDPNHNNPLNFAASASTFSFGLQFDAPLNRQAERNAFRTSLINYQVARRNYMALSDTIEQTIRADLRNLEAQRQSFEIGRQQVVAAARQVEGARQDIIAGSRQAAASGNAATLNILNALQDLLDARNRLASSFFNYEQLRIKILLDMESLQLDERGFYSDELTRTPGSSPNLDRTRTPAEQIFGGPNSP